MKKILWDGILQNLELHFGTLKAFGYIPVIYYLPSSRLRSQTLCTDKSRHRILESESMHNMQMRNSS